MPARANKPHARSRGTSTAKPARVRLTFEERRHQILEAARSVFLRSGLAGARVREISRVAGVNEALLYQHFRSKDELFEAAISEPLEATIAALLAEGVEADPSIWSDPARRREQIIEVLDTLLDGVLEIAPLVALVSLDSDRGERLYRQFILPTIERLVEPIDAVRKLWGAPTAIDARLIVTTAIGTCLMLSLDRRFGGRMLEDRDRLIEQLADYFIYGTDGPAAGRSPPGARRRSAQSPRATGA